MKNVYQEYLDMNGITRYKVAKLSGIAPTTLQKVANSTTGTDGISGKVLKATAIALGKKPWTVLQELLDLERNYEEDDR